MNKDLVAGVVIGLALAGTALIVISNETQAAPFNAVTTSSGTNAFVDRFCVSRERLSDGGFPVRVEAWLSVPIGTTLPDGGVEASVDVKYGQFEEARPTPKTAMLNYMDGALLTGARIARQLEQ